MNPLQRAAFRRKVTYLAAILGLFTLSMFWRGTLPIPLSGTARAGEAPSLPDRIASKTILNRALALELREVEEGEQEVEGSTFRLALVGSRGLVVAVLWSQAIEAQKRNDFHKLDKRVRTVTQLQPHFITPWIFQSWNISYNVSVEMQGSGDMYFYIARGIELLAEGERRQGRLDPETGRRLGSPDMRYQIGFYYSNKFGVSDNVEVLRCLFQMSCMSPDERNADPGGLTNADGTVNLERFRKFCEEHPHLVRRLRGETQPPKGADESARRKFDEALKCPRPEDVVKFLRDNKDVPTRYKFAKELAQADKQFPILPPKFNESPEEANPEDVTGDGFSGFLAARAWYAYGLVPLPPVPVDLNDKPVPAAAPRVGQYDPVKYRVPRQPSLIIFRQGAPRAQSSQAEMDQKEGWFDNEGWRIDLDDASDQRNWWFPDPKDPLRRNLGVVVGPGESNSERAWQKAAQMWKTHGENNALDVDKARMLAYNAEFDRFAGQREPTQEQLDDPNFRKRYNMALAPAYYAQNRRVTNFAFFLASSAAEAKAATVAARKVLWQAEQQRKLGNKERAIALYEQGLLMWRDVLIANKDFHRPEGSDRTDEETYTYELAYLRLLVGRDERVELKAKALVQQAQVGLNAFPFPFGPAFARTSPLSLADAQEEAKWVVVETDPQFSPFVGVMTNLPPEDDRNGGPWVSSTLKEQTRVLQGVQRQKTPQQPPPGMMQPPGMQPVPPGATPGGSVP